MSMQVFTLPDLGEGLTEAELVRWLVEVGDVVAVDAPVAEVETAKAMVEVPSPFAGVVAALHGEEGATLSVGEPLISVDDGGARAGATEASPVEPRAAAAPAVETGAAGTYREEERAGSGNVLIGYGTSESVPSRRRRRAARKATERSGAAGPIEALAPTAPDETAASADPGPVPVRRPAVQSPIVRQLAKRRGIDLARLTGTGPHGLITRRDVETASTEAAVTPDPAAPQTGTVIDPAGTEPDAARTPVADPRTGLPIRARVPLRGLRKAVAETLTRSRREIPEATTWVDVDATALLDLRAALGGSGTSPGLLAMVARFVVAGLARFPELNARVDTDRGEIVHLDGVNLGIAAQTERGLVVPTVRDAHRLGMRGLDTEIRRLTTAARDGSLGPLELTGGSFTLNNYGVLGVDGSAAIINHPEVAILGLGRLLPRPWVVDGQIAARQITQLSLVFDHRVCDGGTAAGFLRFVADAIESPTSAMADL